MLLGAPLISIILSQPVVDVLDITIPRVEAAEGKDDGANLHAEHLSLIDIDSLTVDSQMVENDNYNDDTMTSTMKPNEIAQTHFEAQGTDKMQAKSAIKALVRWKPALQLMAIMRLGLFSMFLITSKAFGWQKT